MAKNRVKMTRPASVPTTEPARLLRLAGRSPSGAAAVVGLLDLAYGPPRLLGPRERRLELQRLFELSLGALFVTRVK